MSQASTWIAMSPELQGVAERAKREPDGQFHSLAHLLDELALSRAFYRQREDAAVGVDGVTKEHYEQNLVDNLRGLHERLRTKRYRHQPIRRVHIPKGDGRTRPLGISAFEDKVVQDALRELLEAVYEQDFLDCSYGFRPGRSAHQALDAVWRQVTEMGGCWIVEVDIQKYFDTLDHAHLRELLKQRVQDGVLLRLIGKWLNAGVLEDGSLMHPDAGTPQGGVISPLLANVYLHYVLDVWFTRDVQPRLRGRSFLVRYADDFVMGFACEEDARRVLEALPQRFGKYGLTLHPDKTRLVPFRRPAPKSNHWGSGGQDQPGSFDLLGFTHYWGRSWKGFWVVKRKTAQGRLSRALTRIAAWCRLHRHAPIAEQHQTLSQKLRGHYAYYGITGNGYAIQSFRTAVIRTWKKWLSRRRRRDFLSWATFSRLLKRFPLPAAQVVHSVYRSVGQPVP